MLFVCVGVLQQIALAKYYMYELVVYGPNGSCRLADLTTARQPSSA